MGSDSSFNMVAVVIDCMNNAIGISCVGVDINETAWLLVPCQFYEFQYVESVSAPWHSVLLSTVLKMLRPIVYILRSS